MHVLCSLSSPEAENDKATYSRKKSINMVESASNLSSYNIDGYLLTCKTSSLCKM